MLVPWRVFKKETPTLRLSPSQTLRGRHDPFQSKRGLFGFQIDATSLNMDPSSHYGIPGDDGGITPIDGLKNG